MKNKIIKLTETEVNELLKQISIDEPKYGLILKLQYIYGRNISEVYNLKKTDVNTKENTITFYMNNDKLTYKVHNEIKDQLYSLLKDTKKEYVFQEGDRPLPTIKDGINYYLHRKTETLNELPFLEGLRLTTKDFKALRGQHLYVKGVPIKTIHELYHNTNSDGTKKTIRYDELKEMTHSEDVDEIIDNTCLEVYTDHNFNKNPIFYTTLGEEEAIVELSQEDTLNFYGEDGELKKSFDGMDSNDLIALLKQINYPGDYVECSGVKFLRN